MKPMSADQALQKLKEGNKRFVSGKTIHPNQSSERRADVLKGQHPFAVVLGCADSRVPPEILFDQGIGDLFILRVAGNIADDALLASMEYAVDHLEVPLLLVLGHQKCGAVQAALQGGEAHGHLGCLMEALRPAVEIGRSRPGDPVENTVMANVERVVRELRSSEPILAKAVKKGGLKILGAHYSLENGQVEFTE